MPETIHKRLCMLCVYVVLTAVICIGARAQRADDPMRGETAAANFSAINMGLLQAADRAFAQSASNAAQMQRTQPVDVETQPEKPAADATELRIRQLAPALVRILERHGVPAGLAAVVAVESGGNPAALSSKGARGLWQLMPQTARRYGLAVDNVRDERLDIERSTQAAAQYLSDLYAQFGTWPLALAAYNWGEQNLAAAIRRTHSSDLSLLFASGALPAETRAYVPAVLARWKSSDAGLLRKPALAGTVVYAEAPGANILLSSVSAPVPAADTDSKPTLNSN